MKHWNKRWVRFALLAALTIACTASVGEARRFFRWWFRPPAPAVENSTFTGDATGRVRLIAIADGEVTANIRGNLEGGEFAGDVTDGILTLQEICLEGSRSDETTTTTTTVKILIDPAVLRRNFFGSQFFAQGEALVTIIVDEIPGEEPPPEEPPTEPPVSSVVGVPTPVPVILFGSIHQHNDGTYHLRGSIRGYLPEVNEETGEVTYTLVSIRLNGSGEVVVDDEPPPEDPPAEDPPVS